MDLAEAAGWPVSNRNKKFVITPPDGHNIVIGHSPNDESMKVFRSACRQYNLVGQGPARTPDQTAQINQNITDQSLAEANRRNAQRKAYEQEQQAKQRQIEAARQKAEAATQQGMTPPEENPTMPKLPSLPTLSADIPVFDPALLGTKDSPPFLLGDGTYYCIECWQRGVRSTYKGPQGLAAHRGVRHNLYPGDSPASKETDRVPLPADVDTAMDMLRVAMAEALSEEDPKELAAKNVELEGLKTKLAQAEEMVKATSKQADKDRSEADKKFLEAQNSADKRVKDVQTEMTAKAQAEVETLTQQFFELLTTIQKTVESYSPAQAVGKVDEIIRGYLS
jgi:hypothetical protein